MLPVNGGTWECVRFCFYFLLSVFVVVVKAIATHHLPHFENATKLYLWLRYYSFHTKFHRRNEAKNHPRADSYVFYIHVAFSLNPDTTNGIASESHTKKKENPSSLAFWFRIIFVCMRWHSIQFTRLIISVQHAYFIDLFRYSWCSFVPYVAHVSG